MTFRDDAMDHPAVSAVTEDELHALLDGQLDGPARDELQARLARDPAAQATLQAWQRQQTMLRGLHASVLYEPVPASLRATADRAEQARSQVQRSWRLGGMAAGLALAFGLGWSTHSGMSASATRQAHSQPVREFVHQAGLAHAVYAPEVRHPVEVSSAQEEHLVQWLSKRLGRTLKLPRLHEAGFELVGGRLLPGDDGARAQFMYQNTRGERVTLYLGSTPAEMLPGAASTEFRYSGDGPVPSFYWVDEGYAYALSGPLSRQVLLQLAQLVYQQL